MGLTDGKPIQYSAYEVPLRWPRALRPCRGPNLWDDHMKPSENRPQAGSEALHRPRDLAVNSKHISPSLPPSPCPHRPAFLPWGRPGQVSPHPVGLTEGTALKAVPEPRCSEAHSWASRVVPGLETRTPSTQPGKGPRLVWKPRCVYKLGLGDLRKKGDLALGQSWV